MVNCESQVIERMICEKSDDRDFSILINHCTTFSCFKTVYSQFQLRYIKNTNLKPKFFIFHRQGY
jgi:hypothetical protein